MAEVQKTTVDAGQMTELFIRFLMMQQQQALLALGRHPNPPPGVPPKNLGLARVFIDQLAMLRIKTIGNLNSQEQELLNSILGALQAAYLEVAQSEA